MPLLLGGGAFALLWLLTDEASGSDTVTYERSRSQENFPPVYSGDFPVPPGTEPGTIVGKTELGRPIIYEPVKEKIDREILQKQKG